MAGSKLGPPVQPVGLDPVQELTQTRFRRRGRVSYCSGIDDDDDVQSEDAEPETKDTKKKQIATRKHPHIEDSHRRDPW